MGRRDIMLLSLFTFVTVLAWIGFEVYHAHVDSTVKEGIEEQLAPITPRFDKQTVANLRQRQVIEPLVQVSVAPQQTRVSTSSASARVSASTSAVPRTATASSGGR